MTGPPEGEVADCEYVSFDGGVSVDTRASRPDRYRFFTASRFPEVSIPRGAGLSYAAASFGKGSTTIEHCRLNRILSFDQPGQTIEVEAGMSLGDLYEFLTPKNLFLATQPGHPIITVGGCIGSDIHGKNQFADGTFIDQLIELSLYHPDHGILRLSRDSDESLFRLTCGGYGLTGNILSAKLKLKAIPSSKAEVSFLPVEKIEDLPQLFTQSTAEADFLFSWHDFNRRGSSFGRGFIQKGKFITADRTEPQTKVPRQTLSSETRGSMPFPVFNGLSVMAMNTLFGIGKSSPREMSIFDCIFPIQKSKELYFKFFGKAGFHECQMIVPTDSFAQYVSGVRQWLSSNRLPITLASAKLFKGQRELLRFTGEGICFALNFPRTTNSLQFLQYLDKLAVECGAHPNIIKDSRLPAEVVRNCYPEFQKFKDALNQFDPGRRFQSELSQRLEL